MIRSFLHTLEEFALVERYTPSNNLVQRLDPRAKLSSITALIITSIFLDSLIPLMIPIIFIFTLIYLSKVPMSIFLKAAAYFTILSAIIGSFSIFTSYGETIASINTGFFILNITKEGVNKAAIFVTRVFVAVSALAILRFTTKFSDITAAMSYFKIPSLFILMLSTTYRFIFLLIQEAYSTILGRECRITQRESRLQAIRSLAYMASNLFIRTYERGERVYSAMLAKGYTEQTKPNTKMRFKSPDWIFCAATILVCINPILINLAIGG